jgi:cobyrinic acid a,c-diamide synthase
MMGGVYISAAAKSSGKTTLSCALSYLLAQDYKVQTFKKGPDYIDAKYLSISSQQPCYNLDSYITCDEQSKIWFDFYSQKSQISIVEGNKGLYDGLDIKGSNCNAAMAKLLNLPVILVINTTGTIRGIAPLLLGYQNFDKDVDIAGVIFNKTAGARHQKKLEAVTTTYTDIPILGCIWRDTKLNLEQRHIGLINSTELKHAKQKIAQIANTIKPQIDIKKIISLTKNKKSAKPTTTLTILDNNKYQQIKLGVIKDTAFNFYYASDIYFLRKVKVKIIIIDSINDSKLPKIDGLFIGGGFPEMRLQKLSENISFMQHLKEQIENGMPCYAECGGLMYLCNNIAYKNKTFNMTQIIDADCKMAQKPIGRGYIQIQPTKHHLWQQGTTHTINAHEFHYSYLHNINKKYKFAYKVLRGTGCIEGHDGIIYKNLLANYAHLQHNDQNPYLSQFLKFIKNKI